jgi:precorrin-8X/cobalt-precorrin-8 methylmutase
VPLFDRYIAVDWSASNSPKVGKDSIWSAVADFGESDIQTANHPTRSAAEGWLRRQLTAQVAAGRRVLVGLDFPYGYPVGFASALGVGGWDGVWEYLDRHISDGKDNISNRFEVAAAINMRLGVKAPFWGRPEQLNLPALPVRKQVSYGGADEGPGLPEWREAERRLRQLRVSPQPVWKLAYTGSVGSQSLVGIPVVRHLRFDDALCDVSRVWPFEVRVPRLEPGAAAIVHAEIWPSIVPFAHERGTCRDEQQVRAVVQHWRQLDRTHELTELFAAAPDNDSVRREEGWVLGVPAPGEGGLLVSRTRSEPVSPAGIDTLPEPPLERDLAGGRTPCL